MRESRIVNWCKLMYRRSFYGDRKPVQRHSKPGAVDVLPRNSNEFSAALERLKAKSFWKRISSETNSKRLVQYIEYLILALLLVVILYNSVRLVIFLLDVGLSTWSLVLRNTLWTMSRVMIALFLSTIWAVPVGIWIGTNPKRIRIGQPIIQVLASFPAPLLYPLALGVFFKLGMNFDWGSILLITLGVQWYVLFNVLAGALRVPQELKYALALMETSRWESWKKLYLPSVFPALATGWITAAGGAWNASILAEYLSFDGHKLETAGIGGTINQATGANDFHLLAASLVVMIAVVVLLNRTLWARLYELAQTRYRLDA